MKQKTSNKKSRRKATLTVITGPMFSGKTGKLVDLVTVLSQMNKNVVIIKPDIDNRYSHIKEIHSHDHKTSAAYVVPINYSKKELDKLFLQNPDIVVFDEAQFFNKDKIKDTIFSMRRIGIHVVVAGLLYDYRRRPFGAMPDLLGWADERLELMAICQKCGRLARHSQRVRGSKARVDVGAADKYIAVCEKCHRIYR